MKAIFVLLGLALVVLFFVSMLVLQLLWNWLMPVVFGLPAITYWQAIGLWALSQWFFVGSYVRRGGQE